MVNIFVHLHFTFSGILILGASVLVYALVRFRQNLARKPPRT